MKINRKTVILLLDDENGINEAAFNEMFPNIDSDIIEVVQTDKGRYFLNETDAERLMESDIPETVVPSANCCEGGQCLCSPTA
jgi:hypothetical protein